MLNTASLHLNDLAAAACSSFPWIHSSQNHHHTTRVRDFLLSSNNFSNSSENESSDQITKLKISIEAGSLETRTQQDGIKMNLNTRTAAKKLSWVELKFTTCRCPSVLTHEQQRWKFLSSFVWRHVVRDTELRVNRHFIWILFRNKRDTKQPVGEESNFASISTQEFPLVVVESSPSIGAHSPHNLQCVDVPFSLSIHTSRIGAAAGGKNIRDYLEFESMCTYTLKVIHIHSSLFNEFLNRHNKILYTIYQRTICI